MDYFLNTLFEILERSLRRKESDEFSEYYLFNAFNCMKAYSYNGERYGYYGYDASGERTYKYDIFSADSCPANNAVKSKKKD